jgi:cytochrome c553
MGKRDRIFPAPARPGFLLLFLVITVFGSLFLPVKGSAEQASGDYDIRRGERFFKGLLPFDRKHNACASCHNLTPSDTLNWNPSAWEISVKYSGQDFESFRSAVMEPMGGKMAEVHKQFNIEDEDLRHVKAYLDSIAIKGPASARPTFFNLMLFLFLGVLLTWALIELIFIRRIKYRFVPVILFLGAFGWQAKMVVEEAVRLGRQQYYAPDQPVKFSHAVHVGEQGIDCMYCHTTAGHSKSAGIPPTNLCLNCHVLIREGTHSGRFEIAKIIEAAEKGENLEWIRIHNLPEHVFFSHAVHVGAARLDCNQCHGPVEEMHIMRQHADLSMGWCVNCHRDTRVDFVDNGYYDTYIKLHEQLRAGKIDTIRADHIGANDCMSCHY